MKNISIRYPSVQGTFYPAEKKSIINLIQNFSNSNHNLYQKLKNRIKDHQIKAILTPHAGYSFSGKLSQLCFQLANNFSYTKFIILGPSHNYPKDKIYFSSADHWLTPLGKIPLIKPKVNKNSYTEIFNYNDLLHQNEHSIEVQVPFIQYYWPKAKILPIITGNLSEEYLKKTINFLKIMTDKETLFVFSSDLSHYHPKDICQKKDKQTINDIINLDYNSLQKDELCGINTVKILIRLSKQLNWRPIFVNYYNSADILKNNDNAVGYAGIIFIN
jgi:hypothetical protein